MDIVERVRSIIVNPGPTWNVIEQEATPNIQALFVPYMLILAAIPAVATFIGLSLIGAGGFGFSVRVPIIWGLSWMVAHYVLQLVMVFVWGWVVNALAGTFGGQANLMNAVKLAVYGSTPGLVAGVFHILPALGAILAFLGALYGLYVIYLGLPVMMKNPPDKTIPYLVVSVVVLIVCYVVVGMLSGLFMPGMGPRMSGF
jgi:hypothetical protein